MSFHVLLLSKMHVLSMHLSDQAAKVDQEYSKMASKSFSMPTFRVPSFVSAKILSMWSIKATTCGIRSARQNPNFRCGGTNIKTLAYSLKRLSPPITMSQICLTQHPTQAFDSSQTPSIFWVKISWNARNSSYHSLNSQRNLFGFIISFRRDRLTRVVI